jgi:hypothetical protein
MKKFEKISEHKLELVVVFGFAILGILVDRLLSSFAGDTFKWKEFGLSCLVMAVLLLITIIAYSFLIEGRLDSALAKLTIRIPTYIVPNLVTRDMESKSKSVWVITKDFFWDTQNEYSKKVVKANLREGKQYRYYCPQGQASMNRIKEICGWFGASHHIEVVQVPENLIDVLSFEYVLYDATTGNQKGILSDFLGRRFNGPDEVVDMQLEETEVLPHFVDLATSWADQYPVTRHVGTLSH